MYKAFEIVFKIVGDILHKLFGEEPFISETMAYILQHHKEEYNDWMNSYRKIEIDDDGWPIYTIDPTKASHEFEVFGKMETLYISEGPTIIN